MSSGCVGESISCISEEMTSELGLLAAKSQDYANQQQKAENY
jgi:hypothetical protein